MTVECLQIEPTTRCNFTCGFCCGRAMSQSDLDLALFERALVALPTVRHLELQGEGEPLMHARFFDMLERAHARGIRVSIVTNGSTLTPAIVSRLVGGAMEKVSVSLESADPATFRALRGGKLDKVTEGIERLLGERDRRGLARPVVGFSVTMLRRTVGHLPGILALYRRLGLDGGITTQPLQRMSAYTAGYDAATAAEAIDVGETEERLIHFWRRTRRIQGQRRSKSAFYDHLMAGWRPTSRSCPWLERGLYVDRNGQVSACCSIKDPAHALGRLGVDSPETMLAARARMRAELASGRTPEACRGCEIARYAVMSRVGFARRMVRGGLAVLGDLAGKGADAR